MSAKIIFDFYFYVGQLNNTFLKSAFKETWRCVKTTHLCMLQEDTQGLYADLKQVQNCFETSDHRSTAMSP